MSPASESLVAGLLERAARALPAVAAKNSGGWWLRHTDSSLWWSGAVLAHGPTPATTLDAGIAAAERFYARHRAAARSRSVPTARPG